MTALLFLKIVLIVTTVLGVVGAVMAYKSRREVYLQKTEGMYREMVRNLDTEGLKFDSTASMDWMPGPGALYTPRNMDDDILFGPYVPKVYTGPCLTEDEFMDLYPASDDYLDLQLRREFFRRFFEGIDDEFDIPEELRTDALIDPQQVERMQFQAPEVFQPDTPDDLEQVG